MQKRYSFLLILLAALLFNGAILNIANAEFYVDGGAREKSCIYRAELLSAPYGFWQKTFFGKPDFSKIKTGYHEPVSVKVKFIRGMDRSTAPCLKVSKTETINLFIRARDYETLAKGQIVYIHANEAHNVWSQIEYNDPNIYDGPALSAEE